MVHGGQCELTASHPEHLVKSTDTLTTNTAITSGYIAIAMAEH